MYKYLLTWIHLILYQIIFLISYQNISIDDYVLKSICFSIIFGWSIYALSSIGHDASHHNFSPWKFINQLMVFICIDCLIMSSKIWDYNHNVLHHNHIFSVNDYMKIVGSNIFEEVFNFIKQGFMRPNSIKFFEWYHKKKSIEEKQNWLTKIFFLIREYRICQLPFFYMIWSLGFLYGLISITSMIFSLLYLTYITHGLRKNLNSGDEKRKDSVQFQLDNSWDIFPTSHFFNFITGGINAHATHHVYPHSTRFELTYQCKNVYKKYPEHYRSVETLSMLYKLFQERDKTLY
jgi:fatty acid desaturase